MIAPNILPRPKRNCFRDNIHPVEQPRPNRIALDDVIRPGERRVVVPTKTPVWRSPAILAFAALLHTPLLLTAGSTDQTDSIINWQNNSVSIEMTSWPEAETSTQPDQTIEPPTQMEPAADNVEQPAPVKAAPIRTPRAVVQHKPKKPAESSASSSATPAVSEVIKEGTEQPAQLSNDEPAAIYSPPNANAAYLSNPAPAYPAESRRAREEGKVLLRVFVGPDGHPKEIVIERSSGVSRLDRAASRAVEQWHFVPAQSGTTPVAAWVVVPIQFSLRT